MAILNLNTDVLPYLKLSADDSYGNVATTHDAVEAFVKTYCNRNFESANYKEVITDYRGDDVVLYNYPITAVSRVAKGLTDVVKIENSNSYSIADVQVTSSGITFTYNTTEDTVAFATYTTLTAVVTQINTLGNGWSASLVASEFGFVLSTELVRDFGQSALSPNQVYLGIAETNVSYAIKDDSAIIITGYYDDRYYQYDMVNRPQVGYYRSRLYNNLYVYYTAGYTSSTMPNDLKQGMLALIAYWYAKLSNSTTGVKSFSISDYAITYENGSTSSGKINLPVDVTVIFDKYKNIPV